MKNKLFLWGWDIWWSPGSERVPWWVDGGHTTGKDTTSKEIISDHKHTTLNYHHPRSSKVFIHSWNQTVRCFALPLYPTFSAQKWNSFSLSTNICLSPGCQVPSPVHLLCLRWLSTTMTLEPKQWAEYYDLASPAEAAWELSKLFRLLNRPDSSYFSSIGLQYPLSSLALLSTQDVFF